MEFYELSENVHVSNKTEFLLPRTKNKIILLCDNRNDIQIMINYIITKYLRAYYCSGKILNSLDSIKGTNSINLDYISIGTQKWTLNNLNVIDNGLGKDHWINPENGEVYYSWKAAVRISEKIEGFHLPSRMEWIKLIEEFGGIINYSNNFYTRYENLKDLTTKLLVKLTGHCYHYSFNYVNVHTYLWTSDNVDNRDAGCIETNGLIYDIASYAKCFSFPIRLVSD